MESEVTRLVTTRNGAPPCERRIEDDLCRGARVKARRLANPIRFALPSVSGFRLVPSEQAPRLRRALSREPLGSGSPVPA